MIISIQGVWSSAAKQHNQYVTSLVAAKIKTIKKTTAPTLTRSLVLWFIKCHLTQILDPNETSFENQRRRYDLLFPDGPARTQADELLKKIFDYEEFNDKGDLGKHWTAYDLCMLAGANICPYCHLVPIATRLPNPEAGVKGYRPDLDHHYPKAKYPFLALSLGNLIPCCSLCNGPKMKHTFDTAAKPILHPQRDQESINFMLGEMGDYESPLLWALQGPAEAYRIELIARSNLAKVENSMSAFQLQGRYNDEVDDILNRLRELRRSPDQAVSLFHFVATTDYRTLPNNGYRRQIKGKLIRDLHDQFCEPS